VLGILLGVLLGDEVTGLAVGTLNVLLLLNPPDPVGINEGRCEGSPEGENVDSSVGTIESSQVGSDEGTIVGSDENALEGTVLVVLEGRNDGSNVGRFEGVLEKTNEGL
jgi:hypothetical protein